jgi:hypothetical protein
MSRSSRWFVPLTFAVLLAAAGSLMLPAQVGHALAPAKQIIYLDSGGQILVDSFLNNQRQTLWGSGLQNGWTNFTTGDFNGDGIKEIIATKGGTIQSFNPQYTSSPLAFHDQLPSSDIYGSGYQWHLLAAGDFRGLGRDQLLVSYQYYCLSCGYYTEEIRMYVFGTSSGWTQQYVDSDDYPLAAMTAGDVNHDGLDDMVIALGSSDRPILAIFAGPNLSNNPPLYAESQFCGPWLAAQVGNMYTNPDGTDTKRPGDEIVLSRTGDNCYNTIDFEYWNSDSGSLDNWGSSLNYTFQPSWTKLALGDADGDVGHDDEVFGLRPPSYSGQVYLELMSPGTTLSDRDIAAGDYASWAQIAAGDVNADGLADLVMIGPAAYRVYYNNVAYNNDFLNVPGSFATTALAVDTIFTDVSPVVTPSTVAFMYDKTTPSNSTPSSARVQIIKPLPTVQWTASLGSAASWLQFSPTSGTTAASGALPSSFTVSFDQATAASLAVGSYSAVVNVQVGSTLRQVTVNLIVANHVNKTDLPIIAR